MSTAALDAKITTQHKAELTAGERFPFGENWKQFLCGMNQARVQESIRALQTMLGVDSLEGKTFVDIGSGSGLSS